MSLEESLAITDPASRHSRHVAGRADLTGVGPWSGDQLYAAVKLADAEGDAVVVDHARERLYLADAGDLTYVPPEALGLASPPELRVDSPRRYVADEGSVGRARVRSTTVSPEFDVLVPDFDRSEPDDSWEPPELEYRERPSGSPSGAVGG